MENNAQDRLDALTGGCRAWFYLMLNFFLGIFYFSLLITGFSTGLGLAIIWVGLPILMLMFAFSRQLAVLDRHLTSRILNLQNAPLADDLHVDGWNPFRRLGAYMTSASTWQRLVYLFLKFPLGIIGFHIGMIMLPFLLFETVLALIGVNFGMITPRITHAIATGLSGNVLLSTEHATVEKPTRQPEESDDYIRARQRIQVEDEGEYYLSDDGEIIARRSKRKRGSVHD